MMKVFDSWMAECGGGWSDGPVIGKSADEVWLQVGLPSRIEFCGVKRVLHCLHPLHIPRYAGGPPGLEYVLRLRIRYTACALYSHSILTLDETCSGLTYLKMSNESRLTFV